MLKFNVITLFPNLFEEHLNNLPFKRAVEKDVLTVKIINLRDYGLDNYGTVDDKTYGGGVGMILRPEPIYNALKDIYGNDFEKDLTLKNIIVLSPAGQKFTQKKAREFSVATEITLICGRYEGIDSRISEFFATQTISIGDYVLSGGELPALVVMETITRLLPDVLPKEEATTKESYEGENTSEYPQYTRPEDFKGHIVPKVLLSGNHSEIEKWRISKRK